MRVVRTILCAALIGGVLSAGATATLGAQTSVAERETVARVQKALERLPYYGVFDFLAFTVDRGRVTLFGYAYRGSLKTEAVQAVKRVRGVDEVVDRIEFLPSSPQDESIRLATFASVYGDDHFSRYISGGPVTVRYDFDLFTRFPNMQPVGMYPIHIIVKNLRTTLLGSVDTDLDRTLASTRARTVPGVLNVDVDVMVARGLPGK
jgi:hyperosmotically inducible periplasmic protein